MLTDATPACHFQPSKRFSRFFAPNCRSQTQCLSIADKLSICQQVTNAMTYLHDKDIVHGRLTSVNIYIEANQRVKISLIDNDEQPIASCSSQNASRRQDGLALNLPTLTYLSPELVKTLEICRPSGAAADHGCKIGASGQRPAEKGLPGDIQVQIDLSLLTKQADIYSFGTLLFELFQEQFPFATDEHNGTTRINSPKRSPSPTLSTNKLFDTLCLAYHSPTNRNALFSPHSLQGPFSPTPDKHWNGNIKSSASELIFQIGSGQIDNRNRHRNKCPALVDHIISACWSAEASRRPNFKQIRFD